MSAPNVPTPTGTPPAPATEMVSKNVAALLPHLQSFCATEKGAWRDHLTAPFTIPIDGAPHTVATDGHVMLVVDGDHGHAHFSEKEPKVGANAAPVIQGVVVASPVTVRTSALREFAGVPEVVPDAPPCEKCEGSGVIECAECDGDGYEECECHCGHEHDAECEKCDGEGNLTCPACQPVAKEYELVRVGARLFNRELLQRAFRYLPDDEVQWHEGPDGRASLLTGDGWRMLVMPMRDEGEFKDIPCFALPAPNPVGR